MRAQFVLQALVSRDADQLQDVLKEKQQFDDVSSKASIFTSARYNLVASATSLPVDFGNVVNASLVYILAYDAVGVQFELDTAPVVPIRPFPALPVGSTIYSASQRFDQPAWMVWPGKVTAIFLSNPSSVAAARVDVLLLGEAA